MSYSFIRHLNEVKEWAMLTKENPLPRMWNMVRLYQATRKKSMVIPNYPYSVGIETTVACNYKCPACPTGLGVYKSLPGKPRLFMDFEAYSNLLPQFQRKTFHFDFTGQGESFLHPRIYDMISLAVKLGFVTRIETNGSKMDIDEIEKSGLHRIHVALDGMSQESYEKYRQRGKFADVKRNLEELVKLRDRIGRPKIDVRFLVFRHNEHELELVKSFLDSLNIQPIIAAPCIPSDYSDPKNQWQKWGLEISPEAYAEWASTLPEYQKYALDNKSGNYKYIPLLSSFKGKCNAPWNGLYIRYNGSVLPCCVIAAHDLDFSMGNIFEEGIEKLWNNQRFQEFRREMLNPSNVDPCSKCHVNYE